ncbi:MAG: glycosyltransferase [Oscillospiraceae bacterium]
MRIAIFAETYFPFISGVVTHIQTLRDGLIAEGHEVLIVTLSPTAKHHYVEDGVLYCPARPLKRIYGYGIANPINNRRLAILRQFGPDIIHIQTEFTMGIFGMYAAKRLHKPMVYTLHTMYDDYVFYLIPNKHLSRGAQPAAHAYIRKVANTAQEVIGPSKKVEEYLRKCKVKKAINVIPNTVNMDAFKVENVLPEDVTAAKEKLGLTPKDTALCFVGRLGKEKSIEVLIDYFANSFTGKPQFKLFIIGSGPEEDSLRLQIERANMSGQIKLLGRIEHDDLPPYYHACNLFATASLTEMNSISMLEAEASGLYVVQRLDINNLDQIIQGENGETYNTPEEFAKIVNAQAALNAEEKKKRRAHVAEIAQCYGTPQFTQEVLKVYHQALKRYYGSPYTDILIK